MAKSLIHEFFFTLSRKPRSTEVCEAGLSVQAKSINQARRIVEAHYPSSAYKIVRLEQRS